MDFWRTVATIVVKMLILIVSAVLCIVTLVVMTVIGAAVGILRSVVLAFGDYIQSLTLNLRNDNPYRKTNTQPAIMEYCFGNIFVENKNVVKTVFAQCDFNLNIHVEGMKNGIIDIATSFVPITQDTNWCMFCISGDDNFLYSASDGCGSIHGMFVLGFNAGNYAVMKVFMRGMLWLYAGLHYAILSLYLLFAHIPYGVMYCVDALYHLLRRTRAGTQRCPNCHREHGNLRPGKYGMLMRTCYCGEKIKTIFRD